jgi:hypothetical protein
MSFHESLYEKTYITIASPNENEYYFTDPDNIHHFYHNIKDLTTIKIPKNSIIQYVDNITWKTNKIILCLKYQLYDLETIQKLDLKITNDYIYKCFRLNYNNIVNLLNYLIQKPDKYELYDILYAGELMDIASSDNYIDVLEWLKNCGLELHYSSNSLDNACANGHINVLEWWFNSGLPLKYTRKSLYYATLYNHINILTWWKNSKLPLKYSECELKYASDYNNFNVLAFLGDSLQTQSTLVLI